MSIVEHMRDAGSDGCRLSRRRCPLAAGRRTGSRGLPGHGFVAILSALLLGVLAISAAGPAVYAQSAGSVPLSQNAQPPAGEVTPDPWPKTIKQGGATYTIYQPQVDSWDSYHFEAHAAVSVLPAGAKEPVFGVIEITAVTHVHRLLRSVDFKEIAIRKATFPSVPAKAAQYQKVFQAILAKGPSTMSLDRFQAALGIEGAEQRARAVPIKNEPPKFVFSQSAAVLVLIDGEPIWRPVQGTSLQRVLNTRALVLRDASGNIYLHLFDGFVQTPALSGPWRVAQSVPPAVTTVAQRLAKERVVDLMEGPPDAKDAKKKASLKNGVPEVIVATVPTELVVTEGQPDWVPIGGTMLLYVQNTTGNVFKNLNDQNTYLLVTGRWFRAPDLSGPWEYVPGTSLPPDFARIPDDRPKENVKASVPGTPQAQEAVIANQIPETATVYRAKAKFTPVINGAPQLQPIPDTPLSYVLNSPTPIIMEAPTQWYALQGGVWFTAGAVQGPWVVAASVPAVIYSIPASSPLHYVTYVYVYAATPEYVVVGYTPGYFGTVVTPDGVVVYGTGYTYVSYVGATIWYPPPITYGYGAAVAWTPWTGWAMGFGFGLAVGAAAWGYHDCCWGCAPYWGSYYPYHGYAYGYHGGAAAWGPGGWAAASGNIYHQWGATTAVTRSAAGYNAWTGNAWSSQVGRSYNSVTGRMSVGQRGAVQNVYTGNYAYGARGATYNPTTGVSARGGSAAVGNAYTGQQGTARWGQVTGPGGQTAGAARVGNNYYADHDGNVYKDTGSGWDKYDNGSWNSMQDSRQAQSLNSQQWARQAGDQRSAGSSWGGNWGGGWGSGSGGGSSWDRGGGGGGSWGGGRFGGGGFGGFRR
jgi:hypothetical protein